MTKQKYNNFTVIKLKNGLKVLVYPLLRMPSGISCQLRSIDCETKVHQPCVSTHKKLWFKY